MGRANSLLTQSAPMFNDMKRQRDRSRDIRHGIWCWCAVFATGICTIHRTNNITQTLWLMQSSLSVCTDDARRRLQLQPESSFRCCDYSVHGARVSTSTDVHNGHARHTIFFTARTLHLLRHWIFVRRPHACAELWCAVCRMHTIFSFNFS